MIANNGFHWQVSTKPLHSGEDWGRRGGFEKKVRLDESVFGTLRLAVTWMGCSCGAGGLSSRMNRSEGESWVSWPGETPTKTIPDTIAIPAYGQNNDFTMYVCWRM